MSVEFNHKSWRFGRMNKRTIAPGEEVALEDKIIHVHSPNLVQVRGREIFYLRKNINQIPEITHGLGGESFVTWSQGSHEED